MSGITKQIGRHPIIATGGGVSILLGLDIIGRLQTGVGVMEAALGPDWVGTVEWFIGSPWFDLLAVAVGIWCLWRIGSLAAADEESDALADKDKELSILRAQYEHSLKPFHDIEAARIRRQEVYAFLQKLDDISKTVIAQDKLISRYESLACQIIESELPYLHKNIKEVVKLIPELLHHRFRYVSLNVPPPKPQYPTPANLQDVPSVPGTKRFEPAHEQGFLAAWRADLGQVIQWEQNARSELGKIISECDAQIYRTGTDA